MTISAAIPNDAPSGAGRYAFDDETQEWIPFKSITDALIAKLHLQEGIPPRYIDTFIDLLRNEDFVPAKLSFNKTTDIDSSIADFRRKRARQRAQFYDFPSTCLPYDIFTHIVEQVAGDRLPLRTDDPTSSFGVLGPGQTHPELIAARLKALALTHRAITPLAQRALGQRIFVHQKEHLLALARSPLLGSWTEELVLNTHFAPPMHLVPGEIVDAVVAALQRSPKLRFLRIRTPPYLDEEGAVHLRRLLAAVGELKHLEQLWWMARDRTSRFAKVDLEDVCNIVSGMPRLRTLALRNVRCGWEDMEANNGMVVAGGGNGKAEMMQLFTHKLEYLSLTNVEYTVHNLPSSLSWLLSPIPGHAASPLSSLTLDLTTLDTVLSSLSLPSSIATLSALSTLRIRVSRPLPAHISACLFSPFSASSPLHTLQLWVSPSSAAHPVSCAGFLAHVPMCVRVLHLSFFQLGERAELWAEQEAQLESYLASLGARANLEQVKIDMPLMRVPWVWPRVREICEARGWGFTVRRDSHAGFS